VGAGRAQDSARAAVLFERACNAGSADGCTGLGRLKLSGSGTPKDEPGGVRAMQRACDGASLLGCRSLALLLSEGRPSLPADPARSAEYYRRACALGDRYSCEKIGTEAPAR
jgi:TPR repeat protein